MLILAAPLDKSGGDTSAYSRKDFLLVRARQVGLGVTLATRAFVLELSEGENPA